MANALKNVQTAIVIVDYCSVCVIQASLARLALWTYAELLDVECMENALQHIWEAPFLSLRMLVLVRLDGLARLVIRIPVKDSTAQVTECAMRLETQIGDAAAIMGTLDELAIILVTILDVARMFIRILVLGGNLIRQL